MSERREVRRYSGFHLEACVTFSSYTGKRLNVKQRGVWGSLVRVKRYKLVLRICGGGALMNTLGFQLVWQRHTKPHQDKYPESAQSLVCYCYLSEDGINSHCRKITSC